MMVILAILQILFTIYFIAENRRLRSDVQYWRETAFSANQNWAGARVECDTAMKQIEALRNQVPGRDNTGRFVKRQKHAQCHGSE